MLGDPPLTPGTFMRNEPPGSASATFVYPGMLVDTAACTVTLTQVGATGGPSAVGTFTASFELTSGGRRNITDGTFDGNDPGFSN